MSAAAVSCATIRPVVPFLRPATADREETASRRTGPLDRLANPPSGEPARLLLISDGPTELVGQLRRAFPAPGHRVRLARAGPDGLRHVRVQAPDVVVLDLGRPHRLGLEVYQQLRQIDARVPVVIVAGARRADAAIEAMKHGAYDVLFTPVELPVLRRIIGEALDVAWRMRDAVAQLESESEPDAEGTLVGSCPAMEEVYKAIGRIADQAFPVLITGETGTGKEVVARAVFQHGPRANAPFLALNCAAIPETLLECELFGHEKGAFTGADRRRIGKFEQANGGTLFLDEVGDMPLSLQAKLLRVLQEQSFERVGGNETIRTDVRLIAATHRDLKTWSAQGRFRADLYYRLGVFTIPLPPLRDRGADLLLMVRHYVRRFSKEMGRDVREVAPDALRRLSAYPWPGNVRELQSVLRQALLRASGPVLLRAFLPEPLGGAEQGQPACPAPYVPGEAFVIRQRIGADMRDLYAEAHGQLDRLLLPRVLEETGGSQHQAAHRLGIARQTLRQKLRDLGLLASRSPGGGDDASREASDGRVFPPAG
jgi:two-component system nitrogen regulation response regulator GlnG